MYERHGHVVGRKRSATHMAWTNMVARCTNAKRPDYSFYGGRGISVCPEWRESFAAFLSDMGERPSPSHSLDRYPDQNGNYEPRNSLACDPDEKGRAPNESPLLDRHLSNEHELLG